MPAMPQNAAGPLIEPPVSEESHRAKAEAGRERVLNPSWNRQVCGPGSMGSEQGETEGPDQASPRRTRAWQACRAGPLLRY